MSELDLARKAAESALYLLREQQGLTDLAIKRNRFLTEQLADLETECKRLRFVVASYRFVDSLLRPIVSRLGWA